MFGWKWGPAPNSPARGNASSGQPGSRGNGREPHYGRKSMKSPNSRNPDSDAEDLAKWMEKGYGSQPDGSLAKTSESAPAREGTVNRNRSGDKLGNSSNIHGANMRDPRSNPSGDQFKGSQQASELDRAGFRRSTSPWQKLGLGVVALAVTVVVVHPIRKAHMGNRMQVSRWGNSGSSQPTSTGVGSAETAVVIPIDYLLGPGSPSKVSPSRSTSASSSNQSKPPKPGGSSPQIIGSKLKPGAHVVAFRNRWNCLTSPNTSEWRYDPTPRILPWPKEPLFGCGSKTGWLGIESNALITAGKYNRNKWPVAESLKYIWTPKRQEVCGAHRPPSFRVFNATEFCNTLRRTSGNLFIAGDSISSHFFISLMNQMETYGAYVKHLKPTKSCQALINSLNMSNAQSVHGQHRKRLPCETYLVCGSSLSNGGKLISFAESMFLRRVHQDSEEQHSLFPRLDDLPELAWGEEMKEQGVSIAVLNRGAHFIRGQIGVDQLNHTLQQVRELMPNALIVFRSTAAGHPNCSAYTSPVKKPFRAEKWPFYWDRFAEQNAVARKMVESIGGVFLDVNPLTTLRPDWHIGGQDCLHYCLPGLTDDWVKVFAKMLHDLT